MGKSSNYRNKGNKLSTTKASSKLAVGRRREKDPGSQRSAETIQRLKMYANGKAIRNKAGKIVAGSFQMNNRAGDREITAQTGRIQPDRRWFGNTRTVAATDLDKFRQEMSEAVADPYSVVLKRKKLPMGLLQDAAEYAAATHNRKAALLEQEPFEHAFGKQNKRKRVKLDQLFAGRSLDKKKDQQMSEGSAQVVSRAGADDEEDESQDENPTKKGEANAYEALLKTAQQSQDVYKEVNNQEGIVPWGRDHAKRNIDQAAQAEQDWRLARKDDLFLKGQSKRIWGEFFKVVDCSDVILHVIDARNVPGTRCTMIEKHIQKNASHKHLVFVLNKIDLVPNWVAKRWMGELAKDRPTIAFHASMTHAFGKGALISLLRQFGKLHEDKKQISVGVIGYPNVGKSSVINTLISKKSCKVAPVPGETKIWQYVTLFKRISLIDCPGVVVDSAGDTEIDSVLKGVVRAERLENPEDFVDAVCEHVKREHINAQYKLVDEAASWQDGTQLLERIATQFGRLRKGGDPCLRTAAIMLINDFQRGRLPHYIAPPQLKTDEVEAKGNMDPSGVTPMKQDLDEVGEEFMKEHEKADGQELTSDSAEENQMDKSEKADDQSKGGGKAEPERTRTGPSTADLIGAAEWD